MSIEPKHIETKEHPDGRKDVTITVNTLDVDLSDPSNVAAKKVIEEQVIPKLANKKVTVTLIHKPTNDHFTFICFVPKVREYASQLMRDYAIKKRIDLRPEEYCVVQHDVEAQEVIVTTL